MVAGRWSMLSDPYTHAHVGNSNWTQTQRDGHKHTHTHVLLKDMKVGRGSIGAVSEVLGKAVW